MYCKAYGVMMTEAPVHVGASAGEETGNLNLIFRDQYTQTGIIPGSSIRGRFRADMRGQDVEATNDWYGQEAGTGEENKTTEAQVKFEYASIVWLPVFCPGQPIVWVTCPQLLKRYRRIRIKEMKDVPLPKPYSASKNLQGRPGKDGKTVLFFNLGFLEIEQDNKVDLSSWIPEGADIPEDRLVVVADSEIGLLHDMALYRQSRVKLENDQKRVAGGAFFNVEALPEGTALVFPIALKKTGWNPFGGDDNKELYFGGLESIGFGRCTVTIRGDL